ncbi:flagellar basal body P-ring formation protein FlgA [Limibaculum sp. M0105]|uniref:Flagella basal body P-ring formation protein FlgA n=1 Tax=Thermohalobaculum xanthum TaxID=2753746 RepID=A0A8J7SCX2_9RHOB|nr:flagellar basal body P-ring formation chaperone FlgA [Thermohalobaculum xanthum]MBK0398127.1 flagellar basal body P-ring formation protein FlgA [Thermohalobaculum xanthum]
MLRSLLMFAALVGAPALAGEVTARRTIPAGTVIVAADLAVSDGDAAALSSRDAMLGLEARRSIYAGRPVVPVDLGPPTLVRRNDVVSIRFKGGGLEIQTEGRALDAGGAGERIRVLNIDSRQPVSARVTAPGLVEIRR